jgi:hypothetical protein
MSKQDIKSDLTERIKCLLYLDNRPALACYQVLSAKNYQDLSKYDIATIVSEIISKLPTDSCTVTYECSEKTGLYITIANSVNSPGGRKTIDYCLKRSIRSHQSSSSIMLSPVSPIADMF